MSSAHQLTSVFLFLFAVSSTFADTKLEFHNDLIPIFTKAGCNAGACHGAAVGRGGFKLSLYGGDPDSDYRAIVRQLGGRRVNLIEPESSLILLKPTQSLEHGGGMRFDFGDESANRITEWIRQGANNERHRSLDRVEITPARKVTQLNEPTNLRATAHYSDGSKQDVTAWTIFTAEDSSAVRIDSELAESTVLRRGRHIVVARFLSEVVPLELVVPLSDTDISLADKPRSNFIDDEVLTALEALRIPVSPAISDEAFRRRVTLDLTGRLPSTEDISTTPPDEDTTSQQVRAKLVDELLASEEFTEYWTWQLARLLRIRTKVRGQDAGESGITVYHDWLAQQIRDGVGYDQFARTLLLATGDSLETGPANFYRTVNGAREQAEFVSELFMGSRLRCANCHDHPLDRWTQDDYHGLAAIFARIDSARVVKLKSRGEVVHPRTLAAAVRRIPGGNFIEDEVGDAREELAAWLTDAQNPFFAKAIVNRLWKSMMGRGLVEPADDFRATNPATHPALLEKLADDFIANGYSLRHTLRLIANSASYARSANALVENRDDDRFYSHAIRRKLEPEVLADAISDVLGVSEQYGSLPIGTRAVALVDSKTPSQSLDILGRCGRDESCESLPVVGGLPQKLHLFNGELLNARIGKPQSRLDQLLAAGETPMNIIRRFYRVAFGRAAREIELEHWQTQLHAIEPENQRQWLEDFVWGLLTSNEFVTNH